MKNIQRNLSFSEFGVDTMPLPRPEPIRTRLPRSNELSAKASGSYDNLYSPSEPASSVPSSQGLKVGRTMSFSYAASAWATPLPHQHRVSDLSSDRLELRRLELDMPNIAERLQVAQQRIENTMREYGFEDQAAVAERDDALASLGKFQQLRERVPPSAGRRSHGIRPIGRRVDIWLSRHGAGPQDAALISEL